MELCNINSKSWNLRVLIRTEPRSFMLLSTVQNFVYDWWLSAYVCCHCYLRPTTHGKMTNGDRWVAVWISFADRFTHKVKYRRSVVVFIVSRCCAAVIARWNCCCCCCCCSSNGCCALVVPAALVNYLYVLSLLRRWSQGIADGQSARDRFTDT